MHAEPGATHKDRDVRAAQIVEPECCEARRLEEPARLDRLSLPPEPEREQDASSGQLKKGDQAPRLPLPDTAHAIGGQTATQLHRMMFDAHHPLLPPRPLASFFFSVSQRRRFRKSLVPPPSATSHLLRPSHFLVPPDRARLHAHGLRTCPPSGRAHHSLGRASVRVRSAPGPHLRGMPGRAGRRPAHERSRRRRAGADG